MHRLLPLTASALVCFALACATTSVEVRSHDHADWERYSTYRLAVAGSGDELVQRVVQRVGSELERRGLRHASDPQLVVEVGLAHALRQRASLAPDPDAPDYHAPEDYVEQLLEVRVVEAATGRTVWSATGLSEMATAYDSPSAADLAVREIFASFPLPPAARVGAS